MNLNVYEIFKSIDGEVNGFHQGRISTFLRLVKCSLKCSFCDSPQAQDSNAGISMPVEEVVKSIKSFGGQNLTITGGEPLEQKAALKQLLYSPGNLALNHNITIETNGAHNIWPSNTISWVVDYKLTPKERAMMRKDNWDKMDYNDWIKMVVTNDTFWTAINVYKLIRQVNPNVNIAFSPMINNAQDRKEIQDIASFCKDIITFLSAEGINDVVLNVQIHKILNLR